MLQRSDREVLAFFFGATPNPMFLSRRWPLAASVNWIKALVWPPYARAVAGWLAYRLELFDGLRG